MRINTKHALFYILMSTMLLINYFAVFYILPRRQMYSNKHTKNSTCETIHIGLVCTGYISTPNVHVLLKSIYVFRQNPIHFHIIVNDQLKPIFNTLFQTWAVPQVNVTFYGDTTLSNTQWITDNVAPQNKHKMLKLKFPTVILTNITNKVMVIDTNLTVTGDIYELWNLFDDFIDEQAIGLFKDKNAFEWEERYGTDLILYHLENLKSKSWNNLCSEISNELFLHYGQNEVTDVLTLNTIIHKNPELLYSVPCFLNNRLPKSTNGFRCKENKIMLTYRNFARLFNEPNEDMEYFRKDNEIFSIYTSSVLQNQLHHCSNKSQIINKKTDANECSEYEEVQTRQWPTLLFFLDYNYSPTKNDVTLISQLSYERLYMIEEVGKLWTGPMSIALYVTDTEFYKTIDFIKSSKVLQKRFNIAYHAVFKDGIYYPINELRNVALRNAVTPYVFIVDIDFLPMPGLYPYLVNAAQKINTMGKKALIVAAFETENAFPKNKKELLNMFDSNVVSIAHYHKHEKSHAPTNYSKWKTAKKPYKVNWQAKYEPYVVVQRNVTEFDKMFFGYGWDKVSHIMELKAQNYSFIVLPDVFIVHKTHSPSYDATEFQNSKKYKTCFRIRKKEFVDQLKRKYGLSFDAS